MQSLVELSEAALRATCKERIETLEHWLRRMIDESLRPTYGDYFEHIDAHGNRLIKRQLAESVRDRQAREPSRYARKIDAALLEDAIDIICKPELFAAFFCEPLSQAFPDGREEARTFLQRLITPRNHLAHSNAISVRQAEQVVCYTNDIIDSLKEYYLKMGRQNEYNVPLILRVTDSFGNAFVRSQFQALGGGLLLSLSHDSRFHLRPGDILRVQVEIDPSFEPSTYGITWRTLPARLPSPVSGSALVVPIEVRHVAQELYLECFVAGRREWHRLGNGIDDKLMIGYRVLPPVSE